MSRTLLIICAVCFLLGLITAIVLTKPHYDCEKYSLAQYANGAVPKACEGVK
jgi:hypothetical protein